MKPSGWFHARAFPVLAMAVLMLAGCAQQQQPGYYEPETSSTQSDARTQAQGQHGSRAPSQLQLGFGDNEKTKNNEEKSARTEQAAATASVIRPLREAKTFLGSVPCAMTNQACSASRLTLTMAPSGEWRARSEALDGETAGQTLTEQGCWHVIGKQPWRIRLLTGENATRAALTFKHNNLLRVNSMNSVSASLPTHLTRQAEIDGIDELKSQPALNCRP